MSGLYMKRMRVPKETAMRWEMDLRDSCCSKKSERRESMAGIEGNAVLIPYTPPRTLLCARRRLVGKRKAKNEKRK
jgi:hypothetical protein